jgi:hypothetical protein
MDETQVERDPERVVTIIHEGRIEIWINLGAFVFIGVGLSPKHCTIIHQVTRLLRSTSCSLCFTQDITEYVCKLE